MHVGRDSQHKEVPSVKFVEKQDSNWDRPEPEPVIHTGKTSLTDQSF